MHHGAYVGKIFGQLALSDRPSARLPEIDLEDALGKAYERWRRELEAVPRECLFARAHPPAGADADPKACRADAACDVLLEESS